MDHESEVNKITKKLTVILVVATIVYCGLAYIIT